MLNFRRAQQLVTLADECSFTHAAEKLGMSQPALSRAIALIEEECGLRLFDRGRAGVKLTSAGEDLVFNVRQILGQLSVVEQNLLMQAKGEAGVVRFAIGPLSAGYLMENLLTECVINWPTLHVVTSILDTRAIVSAVLQGHIDFGICSRSTLEPNSDLIVKTIGTLHMGLFVRKEHPLAQCDDPVTWDAISQYPRAAGRGLPMPDGRPMWPFVMLDSTIECDSFVALRGVTLRTDAIWHSSDGLIKDDLASGKLVEITPQDSTMLQSVEIVTIMLKGRSQLPAVYNVIDAAIDLMT